MSWDRISEQIYPGIKSAFYAMAWPRLLDWKKIFFFEKAFADSVSISNSLFSGPREDQVWNEFIYQT